MTAPTSDQVRQERPARQLWPLLADVDCGDPLSLRCPTTENPMATLRFYRLRGGSTIEFQAGQGSERAAQKSKVVSCLTSLRGRGVINLHAYKSPIAQCRPQRPEENKGGRFRFPA